MIDLNDKELKVLTELVHPIHETRVKLSEWQDSMDGLIEKGLAQYGSRWYRLTEQGVVECSERYWFPDTHLYPVGSVDEPPYSFEWHWCEQCETAYVRCPVCGNNCCNAGYGEVGACKNKEDSYSEKQCRVCALAYEYQDVGWKYGFAPSKEELDKLGRVHVKVDWLEEFEKMDNEKTAE